jgi:hypothetical protein
VVAQRRRHADDDHVAARERGGVGRDLEAFRQVAQDGIGDVVDVRAVRQQRGDTVGVRVDAHALEPDADRRDEHRQPHVAETDDPDAGVLRAQTSAKLAPPRRPRTVPSRPHDRTVLGRSAAALESPGGGLPA